MATASEDKDVVVPRNTADFQRMKIEKLMKNHEKDVFIPDRPKDPSFKPPPEFMRNVWGSSAGAGSGEFHVYRGIRRREYARMKFLTEQSERVEAKDEYSKKVDENQRTAEKKTAKKRAKRQKKKQNRSAKKSKKNTPKEPSESDESSSDESHDAERETVKDSITADTPVNGIEQKESDNVNEDRNNELSSEVIMKSREIPDADHLSNEENADSSSDEENS